ncbi:hypothetical protein PHMEG_00035670 [Phytophthora megakarya]|uniref:Tf2-1-like SH3-like domain-containing protein n=1 Tax=Phytophthora megakarya TaxID=4795 RepID=A0A225UNJ4_9STRA|nr:hypothetical protein PHMEG_00035670 [Phytophthora megakarya]
MHRRIRANIDYFFLDDGILYFQPRRDSPRRICVPDDRDLKDIILYEHHNVASSGHPGCLKTLLALQENTGMSPFVADHGYNPRSVGALVLPTQRGHSQSSLRFLDKQQVILHQCQDELEMAQATMKYFHDRNRPTYRFEPGDQVLLDTRNLDLPHIGVLGRRKLAPRFIGPYPIIRATTPDTYQIGLPPEVKLHNKFLISYLRPYQLDTNSKRLNDVPRLITRDGLNGLQVQVIINKRLRQNTLYYKVRWYGRDVADSWEPANVLIVDMSAPFGWTSCPAYYGAVGGAISC